MSTAIVSTTLYDLNLYYKNNTMQSLRSTSSHFRNIGERKIVGSGGGGAPATTGFSSPSSLLRRNSGCGSTTTTNTTSATTKMGLNNSNKLNNSSLLSLNDAINGGGTFNNNNDNNQSALFGTQGHRKLDRSFSEPVSSAALQQLQQQRNMNNQENSTRYKTELCRPYEENGSCKYGDKCQFAHGAHELRNLARHPKYKTELCRTFHTVGFCPYGPRCHFIHNADELMKLSCGSLPTVAVSSSAAAAAAVNLTPAPRPKALSIGSFSMMNYAGGESSSSPPSSLSESPNSLGSFFDDPFMSGNFSSSSASSNPVTPTMTVAANNAFTFSAQDFTSALMSPRGSRNNKPSASFAQLQKNAYNRVLNQFTLDQFNQRNNQDTMDTVYREPAAAAVSGSAPETPASPVGSIVADFENFSLSDSSTCVSPLDVSRNPRLPIFSQLSVSDE